MEAVLLSPSGRTVLESPVISIGRAPENQFVLNDPRVSLYHVELQRVRQGYTITNLASNSGVVVNAQRLEKNVPHLLATNDMIHIGSTTFRYQVSGVVEEPPLISAQADQKPDLEDHSPAPVEASSHAEQEDTLPASFRAMLLGPSGRTVLDSPVIGIGSAPENQLVLNDPRVSWHHAQLHRMRRGYTITDLASGSGTFVNTQRLKKNVPHLLATNDMIHIEDATFSYQVSTAVEEPPLVSAQVGQKADRENHRPIPVAASASAQVSPRVAQEREAVPSAASTAADPRRYLDRLIVPTAASASTQVSPRVTQEREAAPLPQQRPVQRAKNRVVLFAIFLALLLIVIMGGVVLRGVTPPRVPTTPQAATSQTAVTAPGVAIPHLATSYAGTISALSANTQTSIFLTHIQQSQQTIQGSFQGLGVAGPFTGKVTTDGQVQFTVKLPDGSMAFEGSIKEGGDIAGNYQVLDTLGHKTGYGLWNVSANTLA